ncbi:MAG: WD40 repeat domain-containing protein [Planctomyces sp.]|jgi:WD40 repeat protein
MSSSGSTLDVRQAWVSAQWAHDRPLVSCRFDPSGRFVFSGSEDTAVERFQMTDGAKVMLTGGHASWVNAIGFSKDSAIAVTGACDGKLTWWDISSDAAKVIRSQPAHGTQWVRSLAVSPDGTQVATGGNDNVVRIWKLADGSPIHEFKGHMKQVYSVTWHPSGQFLLSGDLGGSVRQWDLAAGKESRAFDATPLFSFNGGQGVDFGGVRGLAISPDGKRVVAGGLYKASNPLGAVHEPLVLLFDWETLKLEKQMIAEGITQGVIWRLVWLSDGTVMGANGGGNGGHLIFWKTDAEKDYHRFQLPNLVRDMDLHPDGIQVATAHHDRHLRITKLSAKPA